VCLRAVCGGFFLSHKKNPPPPPPPPPLPPLPPPFKGGEGGVGGEAGSEVVGAAPSAGIHVNSIDRHGLVDILRSPLGTVILAVLPDSIV